MKSRNLIGYVPAGLEKTLITVECGLCPTMLSKGWETQGLGHLSIAYIVSAIVGIALCVGRRLAAR